MVVQQIQNYLEKYRQWLEAVKDHPRLYWWESQRIFQENWDIDAADPSKMYDACFDNSTTRRLWHADNWQPKQIMIEFLKFDPMTLRAMFNDLYDENKDLTARISRFQFGMDMILREYKQTHTTSIENNHYHDDYRMIALYQAFHNPAIYAAPYDLTAFSTALQRLGARELPQADDLVRFHKMHRTVMTFIEKAPGLTDLFQQQLNLRKHFSGKSLLLAVDFTMFVAEY